MPEWSELRREANHGHDEWLHIRALTIVEPRARRARCTGLREGDSRWVPAPIAPTRWAPRAQNVTREPDLVPGRHGRMMVSPFTFYRGAAKIMAADLKDTPTAGLTSTLWRCAPVELRRVRLARAKPAVRPERFRRDPARPVRVRRQADGGELYHRGASQRLQSSRRRRDDARLGAAYREAMAEFAEMGNMEIWYARLTEQEFMAAVVR